MTKRAHIARCSIHSPPPSFPRKKNQKRNSYFYFFFYRPPYIRMASHVTVWPRLRAFSLFLVCSSDFSRSSGPHSAVMEFLHTDAFIRLQVVLQSVVYTHGILRFSLSLSFLFIIIMVLLLLLFKERRARAPSAFYAPCLVHSRSRP